MTPKMVGCLSMSDNRETWCDDRSEFAGMFT